MADQDTVLILQGGGALGAYQAGVYQHLLEHHTSVDWVIGTSIGAINSAIIAGNPPEMRVQQLRGFWQSLTPSYAPAFWPGMMPWMNLTRSVETIDTLINGVEGFFKPRVGAAWDLTAPVDIGDAGFYDTSPLRATLEKFVDFDYLNSGAMRLSVCAVDIDDGQSRVFDTLRETIGPEHIMASGALPPGFPPIVIGDHAYWDGGVYSNSPLTVFLEDENKRDALCFMIDLWDATEERPVNMSQVMARYKDIQYASRSKEQLALHQRLQDLQRAIRILTDNLSPAARKKEELQSVIELGCDHTINVVNLIMKAAPHDTQFKDIDFSADTVGARWKAGMHDCQRALKHKAWLRPLPPHAGLVIHQLPQEE
ncbi:MAG: patatin-like phospholipase family protein [Burkholderiaceae bacterium]|nr:patatin-like phospholipase family protein [Burkholderiaceae bacterium]